MQSSRLSSDKQELLHEIKIQYGLNKDVRQLINRYFEIGCDNFPDCIDILQESLDEFVLNDHFLVKFPPNRSYRSKFLKNIIILFETHNWEIKESILERYISLINENQENGNKTHFIVFFIKVSLKFIKS